MSANKAIEIYEGIARIFDARGVAGYEHGFTITEEGTTVNQGGPLSPSRSYDVKLSDLHFLQDTFVFQTVHKTDFLTPEDRFKNGTEVVGVNLGEDVVLNERIRLYSISYPGAFFYQYSNHAEPGVQVLPTFVAENSMRPVKRLLVTIDLEAAQDVMRQIIGDEFEDRRPVLEQSLVELRERKNELVREQMYDEAARVRDQEKHVLSLLDAELARQSEPQEDKLARIKQRSNGTLIEKISQEFSEKLAGAIMGPEQSDVEEYSPIRLRLTPDSFGHARTRIDQEIRTAPKTEYMLPKSYVTGRVRTGSQAGPRPSSPESRTGREIL
jgi:hypothetical protein